MDPKKDEVKDGVTPKEDTSDENLVDANAMLGEDGKVVSEEPEGKETPSDDGKGGGDSETPPNPPGKKLKYKSQEDAEAAYTEAERKMHEATTRAANAEKELAQYRKPAKQEVVTDPNEDIMAKAYEEIDTLPIKYDAQGKETEESYVARKKKSASILSRATRDIAKLEYENTSRAKEGEKEISTKLYKRATADGLSTDDELDLVGMEFGRTDSSKSVDERVSDAVEAVKTRVSRLRDGFVKKQQQAKKDNDDLKVLGGGSRSRPTDDGKGNKDSKPSDMTSAMDQIKQSRKVKKDDLLG